MIILHQNIIISLLLSILILCFSWVYLGKDINLFLAIVPLDINSEIHRNFSLKDNINCQILMQLNHTFKNNLVIYLQEVISP